MSDTLDFLNSMQATSTDIDIEALGANLASLTSEELRGVAKELDLQFEGDANDDDLRRQVDDFIAHENGTAGVTDITHEQTESVSMTPDRSSDFANHNPEQGRTNEIVNNPTAGGPAPAMVREIGEVDDDGNGKIVNVGKRWWENPHTGNRVAHGSHDVDGRSNDDGWSRVIDLPNPTTMTENDVYGDIVG